MAKRITQDEYNNLPFEQKRHYNPTSNGDYVYTDGGDYRVKNPVRNLDQMLTTQNDKLSTQMGDTSRGTNVAENNVNMSDFNWNTAGSFLLGLMGLGQQGSAIATQKDIAEKNLTMAQDAFQWQKDTDKRNYDYMVAENQLQKQREDTAHQREVKDLIAAGLSPLANLKGSTTGSVVSQAMGVSPATPQIDGSGLANVMATAMQNTTAMAGMMNEMRRDIYKADTELEKQKIQHNFEREKINTEFENTMAELEEKYKNEGNLEGQKFINRINEINTKFNNDFKLLNEEKDRQSAEYEAERMSRELGIPVFITNRSENWCADNNGRVSSEFKLLIKELEPYLKETGSSEHSGDISSWNGGISANLPIPTGTETKNGIGFLNNDTKGIKLWDTAGGSANAGSTKGSSSGSSKHENPIAYAEQCIKAFWADDNHKIYIPYRRKYGSN